MKTDHSCRVWDRSRWLVAACAGVLVLHSGGAAFAQKGSSRTPRGTANILELDKKAADAHEQFLRVSADLARDYESAGEIEKAREVLQTILKLTPQSDQGRIKTKIDQLDEIRMTRNVTVVEVDPGQGWVPAPLGVEKGKKLRFQAVGECRLNLMAPVGPAGFSTEDVTRDLVDSIPLGALMGIIRDGRGKLGSPFLIGTEKEVNADTTGQLLLRVNLPPQTKVTGKYQVQVSGDVVAGQ